MSILSWNINGMRSFDQPMKKFLEDLNSDILCFQETKITRDKLTEDLALVDDFTSYFAFSRRRSGYSGVATYAKSNSTPYFAVDGLCGLASTITQETTCQSQTFSDADSSIIQAAINPLTGPWHTHHLRELDSEGRTVITLHHYTSDHDLSTSSFALINVYCPRADPLRPERATYKLLFYAALRQRASLLHSAGAAVIIVGDFNTSHTRLDHCDPDEDFDSNLGRLFFNNLIVTQSVNECDQSSNASSDQNEFKKACESSDNDAPSVCEGSEESNTRVTTEKHEGTDNNKKALSSQWPDAGSSYVSTLLYQTNFQLIDTFRYFSPSVKDAFTCWNTRANARETNYGTRIDYILCNEELVPSLKSSEVLQAVHGSDHCPVRVRTSIKVIPSLQHPTYCSSNFKEFQGGRQTAISNYFSSCKPRETPVDSVDIVDEGGICKNLNGTKSNCLGGLYKYLIKKDIKSSDTYTSKTEVNCSYSNKRKSKDCSIQKSGKKMQKVSLTSYFNCASQSSNSEQLGNSDTSKSIINKKLSLYDEEMLFIKNNPELYKRLQVSATDNIDMNLFRDCVESNSNTFVSSVDSENSNEYKSESNICSDSSQETSKDTSSICATSKNTADWSFMSVKKEIPLCSGHKEPCVLRITKKKGTNFNRKFYACKRGIGKPGQENAQCAFFKWA